MEVAVPESTYGQPLLVLVGPWVDLLSASRGQTRVLKWVDIVRFLAGWFGGHDICWRLPGGDTTMKALYLKTTSHLFKVFLFRIGIELRPIPGGFSSSKALDAIGNRCNHRRNWLSRWLPSKINLPNCSWQLQLNCGCEDASRPSRQSSRLLPETSLFGSPKN